MKKQIIILMAGAMLAFIAIKADAQMTLEHDFPNGSNQDYVVGNNANNMPLEVADLLLDGKKYVLQDMINYQVRIYNLDFSLWKTITLPTVPGYIPLTAYYISENLFKIDGYVDMAVSYQYVSGGSGGEYNQLIIDQTGAILNTLDSAYMIQIFSTGTDTFKAITGIFDIVGYASYDDAGHYQVYSLPGTVPCNSCSSSTLGVGMLPNGNSNGSMSAIPNPTSGDVKISYNLPIGISNGTITLNNQMGQKIQSYKVSSNSPYLIISTSNLAAGMYYYTLTANGMNPITQKLIVN